MKKWWWVLVGIISFYIIYIGITYNNSLPIKNTQLLAKGSCVPLSKMMPVSSNVSMIDKDDLPGIINEWKDRVVYIKCEMCDGRYSIDNCKKTGYSNTGSGIFTSFSSTFNIIITNAHLIITPENSTLNYASGCIINFIEGDIPDIYIPSDGMILNEEWLINRTFDERFDTLIMPVNNPGLALEKLGAPYKICSERAKIGEKVIILGYPAIGSREGITVTDGIISGYEQNLYITSAKIDKGNSGGAAILVEDNCYLGIPTYSVTGEMESLGRILDINESINKIRL